MDNSVDIATKFNTSIDVVAVSNQDGWNFVSDNDIGMPLYTLYTDKDITDKEQPILINMINKINVGLRPNLRLLKIGGN